MESPTAATEAATSVSREQPFRECNEIEIRFSTFHLAHDMFIQLSIQAANALWSIRRKGTLSQKHFVRVYETFE